MKISLFAYFTDLVNEIGIENAAERVRECGYTGVEFFYTEAGAPTVEAAKEYRAALGKAELAVPCVSCYADIIKDFTDGAPDRSAIEALKRLSDFTNARGDTIETELFWGYYFNIGDERLVDPIVPVNYERSEFFDDWMSGNNIPQKQIVNKQKYDGFDIAAGQNQTFVITVTSTADTPAGEYSATVRVLDKDGKEVKKVTVFTYVWNFTLSDETACKTLMDIGSFSIYGVYADYAGVLTDETGRSLYQIYYDYLLENRICGYTIPGMDDLNGSGIYSEQVIQYMNNPRVVAFQTLGWKQNLNAANLTNAYHSDHCVYFTTSSPR